jgi:hypothetical protein
MSAPCASSRSVISVLSSAIPRPRWIPTRSATPSTALVPQRKVGFPIPNAGLLLGFQGTKTARREGISSPFSDAGGCTSPQNSGPPRPRQSPYGYDRRALCAIAWTVQRRPGRTSGATAPATSPNGSDGGLEDLTGIARIGAAEPISGNGFELQAIGAAVIGGASLFGGLGNPLGSLIGADA